MRIPFIRTTLAAAAVLAAVVTPAQGATGKTEQTLPHDSAYYERALAEEAANAPVLEERPEVAAANEAVRARVHEQLAAGSRHSFTTFTDPTIGKAVLLTDAPREVVATLVGEHADHVTVIADPVLNTASRKYDSAPFYGGAGIQYYNDPPCTTGYAVKTALAKKFLVTAGHCYDNGQSVWVENSPNNTQNTPEHLGSVSLDGYPAHDMALIGGKTYSGNIYVGGTNSTTSVPVATASNPIKGVYTYCHSGRSTGEQCGHGVVSLDAEVCNYGETCRKPVAAFKGGVLNTGGDSGAPFYTKFQDSSVAIRGHVIAANSTYGFAETWGRVQAKYNVSIVTPGA
ncbi:hypothetical protein GCM10010492_32350 [Saccharothrix mutabilis subsp. mutabilis]|uniref:Serine protease n=1 Tax=Saccharothrix mutabilis subsp. mutabilis TaxID=66855 RepID=A0ABP3DIE0_9PSEU